MAVAQRKLRNVPHLQPPGAVLHVHDAVVGGAADDRHSRLPGDKALQVAHIGAPQRQYGPAADAPVHVGGLAAEGVNGEFPDGVGGLVLDLHHLRPQGQGVHPQVVHVPDAPIHLQVLAQQDGLADAQMVYPLGHGAPVHQRKGAGGAAGHDLQLPPDALLHPARQRGELVHLLRRGLGGAVAAQIHADARQLHMGQFALHPLTDIDQLVLVPIALAQIAQVGHNDDSVCPVLTQTFLLQRQQRGPLALQRGLAQRHHVVQLRQAGYAYQQPRARHTGGAAFGHLLQPAGAQLLRPGGQQRPRRLRDTVYALYHAAHADARPMAAGDHGLRVAAQQGQVKFQLGILPHSDTS